jgi:pyrroloquinoline quinone biosynthesis protein E
MNAPVQLPAPMGLLAELTHRCPLACPYCSNPLALEPRADELTTQDWKRVFSEAAALGVLHVHLSGGEPASRRDLVELVAHCASLGLYTNLITSGVGISQGLLDRLVTAGLDHVQLSIQDSEPASADHIAGYKGGFVRKRALAKMVVDAGVPLTINAVIHHANAPRAGAMVELAIALGARRVEVAHAQYYGWAIINRAQLMPTRAEAERAIAEVERLKELHAGEIVIDHVVPDYHARYPKACMGGWARRTLNVTPSGKALPCHAAETIPQLQIWNVKDRSLGDIWHASPAFNAFRGTEWMREPCKSCARKDIDFGGCRCQALAIAGDATAADPICHLSPDHHKVEQFLNTGQDAEAAYVYRR